MTVFIVLAVLTACSPSSATETAVPDIETVDIVMETEASMESGEAYPPPAATDNPDELYPTAAYPIETQETVDEEIVIPEPNPDFGIVHGIVNSLSIEDMVAYTKVYLATKVPVEPGDEYIISVQENSSPHTQTNGNGEFVISEIPPGDYVLVLVTPVSTFPILTESGEQIELLIEGGELIDLGDIFTNWPNF
jgi:hypothetical protein